MQTWQWLVVILLAVAIALALATYPARIQNSVRKIRSLFTGGCDANDGDAGSILGGAGASADGRLEFENALCEYRVDGECVTVDRLMFNSPAAGDEVLERLERLFPNAKLIIPVKNEHIREFLVRNGFRHEELPEYRAVYSRRVVTNPHAVFVLGMPGCGKTTLMERIQALGVECHDFDDLYTAAEDWCKAHDKKYRTAMESGDYDQAESLVSMRFIRTVDEIVLKGDRVLMVGTGVNPGKYRVETIVLKIPPEENYRRQFSRFINKVCAHAGESLEVIRKMHPNDALTELTKLGVHPSIVLSWPTFLSSYREYYSDIASGRKIMDTESAYRYIVEKLGIDTEPVADGHNAERARADSGRKDRKDTAKTEKAEKTALAAKA
jgi:shikimate kinase